jgi:hypothetical protein
VEGSISRDDVRALRAAQAFLIGAPGVEHPTHADGTPATRQELTAVFGKIRFWAWASWVGTVFLIVLALCFFLSAIN